MRLPLFTVLTLCLASPALASSEVAKATDGTGAIGHVACSVIDGEPLRECPFEATYKDDGTITLRVSIGIGKMRIFYIEGEEITGTNSLGDLGYRRGASKTFAHITPTERYEIPNDVFNRP